LIERAGNSSFKQQQDCINAFTQLYRHPSTDLRHAIEAIMDVTEKDPGILKQPKDKMIVRLTLF